MERMHQNLQNWIRTLKSCFHFHEYTRNNELLRKLIYWDQHHSLFRMLRSRLSKRPFMFLNIFNWYDYFIFNYKELSTTTNYLHTRSVSHVSRLPWSAVSVQRRTLGVAAVVEPVIAHITAEQQMARSLACTCTPRYTHAETHLQMYTHLQMPTPTYTCARIHIKAH